MDLAGRRPFADSLPALVLRPRELQLLALGSGGRRAGLRRPAGGGDRRVGLRRPEGGGGAQQLEEEEEGTKEIKQQELTNSAEIE